ncbi:MAG: CBS domain-containing protein [Desulfarculaceae bacterium]|nr:CBS domain-containing protein [Desulfarculaceae bacterium]MCF8046155.1 CBS domain-containing protein [Desulfarculaceae bacterium]MCF8065264.1 CBS domain-containing protein [Desulfarculaceae bacterium]MCF8097957.1 CBS domain-containing protein [Desulfarculaceae bacterium]MCF8123996.1 CBS domain-containing protein [Desulfarculaceae bacterium]
MKTKSVKDIMVPLAEYATTHQEATLFEAVQALEKSWDQSRATKFKHRAVLVLDAKGYVIGKVSHWDLLQALEPKYRKIADFDRLTHFGLNPDFMKSMVDKEELWDDPWNLLCARASNILVKNAMRPLSEDDFIDEDSSLAHATHMLVMARKLSVLVRKSDKVVGVLRVVDVCDNVCEMIKTCSL